MFLLGWMCRILVLAPLPVLHHKSTKYQEQQSQNSLCEAGEGHSWEASLKRGLCVRAQSDSLWSHGLWPSRLLRPWNFSGKNTGMCCHFLLQGIFRSQGSNPHLQHLLRWQVDSLPVRVWVLLPQRSVLIRAVRNEWWKVYSKSPTYKPSRCQLSHIWFQQGIRTCVINTRCEWNCSLPSISYSWGFFSSTIFHLLPHLQSVTLLACVLDARLCILAVVLYYCIFQGTVRLKMFLVFVSLCIICVQSIVNRLQYRQFC